MIKSGQSVAGSFITSASTGALVNADSTPTGLLMINGASSANVVTVTNRATGKYLWSATLPTLNAGDIVETEINAVISSTSMAGMVWQDSVDTKRVSDLNDIAAGASMGLSACAIDSTVFAQSAADKVWLSSQRTLTMSAATLASILSGSMITARRGDSFTLSLTGLGDMSDYSELYFAVKDSKDDTDESSRILLTAGSGLRYINGSSATSSNGAIVITNASTGAFTATVRAIEMAKLVEDRGMYYDVQVIRTSGCVTTLSEGIFNVSSDITRYT